MNIIKEIVFYNVKNYKMSFFEKTNNNNKCYVYIVLPKYETANIEDVSKNTEIQVKIIVSKIIIPHNYSYIYENYKTIVKKHKEDIYDTYILTYFFDFTIPEYPYNLFVFNRITLHSFLKVCKKIGKMKNMDVRQINFLCSSSYLKRTKEWGPIWKKNKYTIDKTNETMYNMCNRILSSLQKGNTEDTSRITKKTIADLEKSSEKENRDNENLFSIYTLSKYYFNIKKEKENFYKCEFANKESNYKLVTDETDPHLYVNSRSSEENLVNYLNKRPNYDYIDYCIEHFGNENYKIII